MAKAKTNAKKKYTEEEINELVNDNLNKNKTVNNLNYKINIKCKNEKQKYFLKSIKDPNTRIIFVRGSAGTGKTLISLYGALHCLKNPDYNIGKILISKIIIPAARDIGYLKGELEEKIAPYFEAYWNNIQKLVGQSYSKMLKDNELVKESLVNFVRGDTFGTWDENNNPIGEIAIMDEAQNTNVTELKTFISRMGEESKLIIMGDNDQVDIKLKKGEQTGLDDAFERFKEIDGIEFVEFTEDDIVRDPFLIQVMKCYEK